MTIRFADAQNTQEIEAMVQIYAPWILESHVSFELTVPDVEEFRGRVLEYSKKFPWLVYEENGKVLGYAYASAHRSRCAYDWSAECSVYIDKSAHRKGIARALYTRLFEIIKLQGVVNVLAGIGIPNEASVRFHESMGFVPVAMYKNIGFKLGSWWDVGWWQLELQKPEVPKTLTPYQDL